MPKIYISPTNGTSEDLPPELSHFFQEEECEYRNSIPVRWLSEEDENCPKDYRESFKNGREIVYYDVQIYDGSIQQYVSYDYPGIRYYFDYTNLEEDLEAIINLTGLRVVLSCRDVHDKETYEEEFRLMVYGEPVVEGWVAELETEAYGLEKILKKTEEGESWKTIN